MKHYAVIVAGGTGSRMGIDTPKQFLLLNNKHIIIHTIKKFLLFDPDIHIIVALPEAHLNKWEQIQSNEINLTTSLSIVLGGPQRFFTVRNALEKVPAGTIVTIHDAVRPLVSIKTIAESFDLAQQHGSAIPYIIPNASVRLETENGNMPLDRSKVRIIQTPQTFLSGKIKEAYQQDYQDFFTDDATVWETAGNRVTLFKGNIENIKITFPFDLKLAEYILFHEGIS